MCTSALLDDDELTEAQRGKPKRLLLLLATQNADKPAKPAAFEQRLAMMELLAEEVRRVLQEVRRGGDRKALEGKNMLPINATVEEREKWESVLEKDGKNGVEGGEAERALGREKRPAVGPGEDEQAIIDVGVTKKAMFMEKAQVIEESGFYRLPPGAKGEVEQVHLTGYDTLIRLLDTKYYPPGHTLAPLKTLFEKHRIRVTRRPSDWWGSMDSQDGYLKNLASGGFEQVGARREWGDRIQLVDGKLEKWQPRISSSRVRDEVRPGNIKNVIDKVPKSILDHIVEQRLYEKIPE